jgi:uncharacterized protein YdhG (YjbR/CyaY superfamily)
MRPVSAKPSTVDAYIAQHDPAVQALLQQVRATVRAAAPEAQETISYGMPALRQNGMLVYFAAFKAHIGFYPPIRGDAALEAATAPYAGEKGNLRFPYAKPIPFDLISALTQLRVAQDRAKHAGKRVSKKPLGSSDKG